MNYYKMLFVLLMFTLIACGEDESDNPLGDLANGSFDVTVTGAVNLTSNGGAQFIHSKITNPDLGQTGSNIIINLEDDSDSELFTSLTIVIPIDVTGVKTGTYAVNLEPSGTETVTILSLYTSDYIMGSTSGSITLSEIKDLQVKGSFSATVGTGAGFTENESTITGDFTATGITQTID